MDSSHCLCPDCRRRVHYRYFRESTQANQWWCILVFRCLAGSPLCHPVYGTNLIAAHRNHFGALACRGGIGIHWRYSFYGRCHLLAPRCTGGYRSVNDPNSSGWCIRPLATRCFMGVTKCARITPSTRTCKSAASLLHAGNGQHWRVLTEKRWELHKSLCGAGADTIAIAPYPCLRFQPFFSNAATTAFNRRCTAQSIEPWHRINSAPDFSSSTP